MYSSRLEYTVQDLLSGQPYSFWVTAHTQAGEGAASAVVTESPSKDGEDVPPRIYSLSRDLDVARGDNVSLPCSAFGSPDPARKWMFKLVKRESHNQRSH